MLRSIRALLVVALASSGLWLGGAVPASAYTGYQVVERTYSLPAGGYVRNVAQCPAGTVVLGGGADVVGSGSANFDTELQESAPGTNSNGYLWLATVSNNSAHNYTLGIWAICGAAPSGYQIEHSDVTLPSGNSYAGYVSCPTGQVVLSGGVSVIGEGSSLFNIEMEQSSPSGEGTFWLADYYNGSVNAHTVDSATVCAAPPAGWQIVDSTFTLPVSAGTNFVRASAVCPAGKVVVGGGSFVNNGFASAPATEMQESAPGTSSGQSLWLSAVSNHASKVYSLSLSAICVS